MEMSSNNLTNVCVRIVGTILSENLTEILDLELLQNIILSQIQKITGEDANLRFQFFSL